MPQTVSTAPANSPAVLQLFTALWPDDAVQRAMVSCRDTLQLPAAARPVAAPRLHMVLHNLGAWPSERLPELQQALPPIRRGFEIRLAQFERWPGDQLVLCPDREIVDLRALYDQQVQALERAGLGPVDVPSLRPHVLLARECRGSFRLKPVELRWRIGGYALVSALADGRYEVLRNIAWG